MRRAPIKVLYIGGYGHSGSTILDVILHNSHNAVGLGEIRSLFEDVTEEEKLDRLSQSCRAVFAAAREEALSIGQLQALHKLTLECENFMSPVGKAQRELYRTVWKNVFETVAKASGRSALVDSSKTAFRSALRPYRLSSIEGIEVCFIHLLRDPTAVIHSMRKKAERQGRPGSWRNFAVSCRAGLGWLIANCAASQAARRMRYVRIRYEDLGRDPVIVLDQIQAEFDLDLTRSKDLLRSMRSMKPGCGVAGNRMRAGNEIRFHPDEGWREAASLLTRAIGSAAGLLFLPFQVKPTSHHR